MRTNSAHSNRSREGGDGVLTGSSHPNNSSRRSVPTATAGPVPGVQPNSSEDGNRTSQYVGASQADVALLGIAINQLAHLVQELRGEGPPPSVPGATRPSASAGDSAAAGPVLRPSPLLVPRAIRKAILHTNPPKGSKDAIQSKSNFRILMKREKHNSPFTNMPSVFDVDNHNSENGHCCTTANYRLDLNLSVVTLVFVRDFLQREKYVSTDKKIIKNAFVSHFRHLRRKLVAQLRSAQETLEKKTRRNTETRKHTPHWLEDFNVYERDLLAVEDKDYEFIHVYAVPSHAKGKLRETKEDLAVARPMSKPSLISSSKPISRVAEATLWCPNGSIFPVILIQILISDDSLNRFLPSPNNVHSATNSNRDCMPHLKADSGMRANSQFPSGSSYCKASEHRPRPHVQSFRRHASGAPLLARVTASKSGRFRGFGRRTEAPDDTSIDRATQTYLPGGGLRSATRSSRAKGIRHSPNPNPNP
ncbi:hypothetical protein BV25DRAFT_1841845 [Artomyces pyxidatus]|uniref:Uncharacterized protein n=1 Tax=Artomyces pyxidatus TaxID=48021 RepID=A0ACB8SLQ1_9AGAM|nr:hypothetical protein BV25DRAFT_1841845 [Artomyces pyxidatus]